MSSLDPSHQHEIDALIKNLTLNKPKDIIQHCANYFNSRLASDRESHRSGTSSSMTDPAGRGPFDRARNQNTIQEEDEERDSFGSPTQPSFKSNASPFSSPFGASSGGGGGGSGAGLFGGWMGGQGATDDTDAAQHTPANFPGAGRRTSVSAEAMQPDADSGTWRPPTHKKTQDQLDRLKTAVQSNFLFKHLDDESFGLVLGALSEKVIPAANIRVINQGDEGDYFYVVEEGEFDIYIRDDGQEDGQPTGSDVGKKVASVTTGGSKFYLHPTSTCRGCGLTML